MLYSSISTSNPVTNFALYRRLWRYLAPYWKGFFIAVIAMVIASLTTPLFALLTKPLVDKGFVEHNHYYTTYIPLAIIGLFLLRGAATYINDYLVTYLSSDLVHQIRLEMYQKIMQLPVSFFKNIPSGRLVSKVINDANQITDAGFNVITVLAKDGVMVLGLITVLFYLDWQLTLITIATLLAVSLLIHLVSSRLRHLTRLNQGYMGNMTQLLQESISGVKEIKIYQSYRLNLRLFSMISHAVKYNLVKQRSANSLSSGITQWLIAIALAAIIYFAGLRAQEGFTPGAFMSFITSMIAMFDPMKRMTDVMQSLQRGMAGTQSVFTFLDEAIENDQGEVILNGLKEAVVFDQVYFRYAGAKQDSLKNINLTIEKGKIVALVGASGSGKSTLAALIPRFYEPTSGRILIDGEDNRHFTLLSLRQQLAVVNQDIVLFDGTVAENVAYGIEHPDIKSIEQSLKSAYAWTFVNELPEGINTKIGENGSRLSGGQRQRLMIARALLKNAPLLILDEATSALDLASEKQVRLALNTLMQNRTSLVIAHRLSTIEAADLIVVMHAGEIVEQGKHQQLLAQNGYYKALYQMQFRD